MNEGPVNPQSLPTLARRGRERRFPSPPPLTSTAHLHRSPQTCIDSCRARSFPSFPFKNKRTLKGCLFYAHFEQTWRTPESNRQPCIRDFRTTTHSNLRRKGRSSSFSVQAGSFRPASMRQTRSLPPCVADRRRVFHPRLNPEGVFPASGILLLLRTIIIVVIATIVKIKNIFYHRKK